MRLLNSSFLLLCALCSVRSSVSGSETGNRYHQSYANVSPDGQIQPRQLATCSSSITWESSGGNLLLNGKPFHLKGSTWFGFETETNVVHGLWGMTTMDAILDFCSDHKINALRIPISLKLALDPYAPVSSGSCSECDGASGYDILDRLFNKTAERGILILLDMHRLNDQAQSELWYDSQYSEAQFIEGWHKLVERFGNKPNLLGLDLKNEPYGRATWNKNYDTDWDKAAVRISQSIFDKFPSFNKLIFIEGVGTGGATPKYSTSDPSYFMNWGMNLHGVTEKPIDLGSEAKNKKVVYSPHVYGPSVSPQTFFNDGNFPGNMPAIWDKQIGFIEGETGRAVVIGEWGGRYTGSDKDWQDAWGSYMASHCISDNFVWCINPNSGDTGGLLKDDWKTPDWGKLALLEKIQPNPSVFTSPITSNEVCVEYGSFANANCASGGSSTTVPFNNVVDGEPAAPVTFENEPEAPVTYENPPEVPPPTEYEECAQAYKQCGGKNFRSKCCPDGFECTYHNIYWSGCDKVRKPKHDVIVADEIKCNTAWSQCGGQNWTAGDCCPPDFACEYVNEWYSQCKKVARVEVEELGTESPSDSATEGFETPPPKPLCSDDDNLLFPGFDFPEEFHDKMGPGILPVYKKPNGTESESSDSESATSTVTPCKKKEQVSILPYPEVPKKECIAPAMPCGGKGLEHSKCCKGFVCKMIDEDFAKCVPPLDV